ncbi:MAG: hypothetical protein JXA77_16165 [Bacteroidales bacterium]|nr:hypothetical protein [Bacteroidales bacterium]MBN2821121.1 hypothetical protein [Bacteroidales bacterium]
MEKKQLPNATAVLVLGILSIVLGCVVLGFVCGIVGLVMSKEGYKLYGENPDNYVGYGSLSAGRIMSILLVLY